MGYLANQTCFDYEIQAQNHYYSTKPPIAMPFPTGDMYVLDYVYEETSESWLYRVSLFPSSQQQHLTVTAMGTPPIVHYPYCEMPNDKATNFQEGMELGWAVAGVMVVVYCIARLRRGF